MKKNYLLGLIVLGLLSLSVYSTYAMFTSSVETNDIVSLSASTLPTESEIVEYERLTIKSKEKKVIEYTVNNNTNSSLYYGVWYEMINPSSINDDIVIGKSEDTQNDTLGQLTPGSNAKVLFVIDNKSSSNIVINVGVGYSETSSLNLPTNRNLITEIYEESVLATEYITELYNNASKTTITNNNINYSYATSVGLMNDRLGGTTTSLDVGNIRYYGADPNNYVSFNNELWRIIGVFKDIDDGTGKTETRVKIIRSESIGNYSWDHDLSNNWSSSDMKELLNEGAYYNKTIGQCYIGNLTTCDFTTIGLNNDAKNFINNSLWYLGGSSTYKNLFANNYYSFERGTTTSSVSSYNWVGQIGLINPSDYMYSGDFSVCNKAGYNWDTICRDSSWLKDTSNIQWTINPNTTKNQSQYVFYILPSGYIDYYGTTVYSIGMPYSTYPTLFLKSSVLITGGDGSSSNPYTLSL